MNDKTEIPDNEPNENSSLDELAAYALVIQNRLVARDKEDGKDLWLMGQALNWAYEKTPYGGWEKWWKAKGFRKTFVWQARQLHEKATLDQVTNLGLTEMLRKFKILSEKKMKKPKIAIATSASRNSKKKKKTLASNDKTTESTIQDDGGHRAEGDEVADEEEKELKTYQEALRKETPNTRAVAIQHALELLRNELKGEEIDEDLQQTFSRIAELAEELKGLKKPTDATEAA